jgi:hypothetical protein
MAHLSLEGLRQCFADPDVRLRTTPPDSPAYPRILSVTVTGGFLKDQEFKFSCGLNSVLGGRSAGKSLLVELIRFALDQKSEIEQIAIDHLAKLQKRFGCGSTAILEVSTGAKCM